MKAKKNFIIIGGGTLCPGDLPVNRRESDLLAAADAGYRALLNAGQQPDLLIGDFDSLDPSEAGSFTGEIIRLPVEKDDTDSIYCIKTGFARGYKDFLLYGMLGGGRISHTFANVQLLSYVKQNGGNAVLAAGDTRIFCAAAGEQVIINALNEKQMTPYETGHSGNISIFSLSDEACVSLENLYYPGDRLILHRSFPLGVSNHLKDLPAKIKIHSGDILVISEGYKGIDLYL